MSLVKDLGPSGEGEVVERSSSCVKPGGLDQKGPAIVAQLHELATDLGRLSRTAPNPFTHRALDRIAQRVETLHGMVSPKASDLYRELIAAGLSDSAALFEALKATDAEARALRARLKGRAA